MDDIKHVVGYKSDNGCETEKHNLLFENQILQKWLTTKEASFYLGISPNALRIWVCRGKAKAFKLGNKLRFKIDDLDNLLNKQEVLL